MMPRELELLEVVGLKTSEFLVNYGFMACLAIESLSLSNNFKID